MEDFETFLIEIDTCLPTIMIAKLIITLNQTGINTEIILNKRKLIILIQNYYEDIMEDDN